MLAGTGAPEAEQICVRYRLSKNLLIPVALPVQPLLLLRHL